MEGRNEITLVTPRNLMLVSISPPSESSPPPGLLEILDNFTTLATIIVLVTLFLVLGVAGVTSRVVKSDKIRWYSRLVTFVCLGFIMVICGGLDTYVSSQDPKIRDSTKIVACFDFLAAFTIMWFSFEQYNAKKNWATALSFLFQCVVSIVRLFGILIVFKGYENHPGKNYHFLYVLNSPWVAFVFSAIGALLPSIRDMIQNKNRTNPMRSNLDYQDSVIDTYHSSVDYLEPDQSDFEPASARSGAYTEVDELIDSELPFLWGRKKSKRN